MLDDHDMENARNVARDLLARLDLPVGSASVGLNVSENGEVSFTIYLRRMEDRELAWRFTHQHGYPVRWEPMPVIVAG